MARESDEEKSTYVRIDNANLNKLNIRRMSMLYTDYANLLIEINRVKKEKVKTTANVQNDLENLKENFKKLYESLPKESMNEIAPHLRKLETAVAEKRLEMSTGLESFESLKKEFERIRNQLENIK
jgi:uncharacterized coiled-coil protein SlyX